MSTPPSTAVPVRPALGPSCRLVFDGRRYLVEQAGTVVTFEGRAVGPLLQRLLPLLDGTRTIDDLIRELGPSIGPAIDQALELLDAHRLLVDGPSAAGDDETVAAADFAVTVNRRANRAAAARALGDVRIAVLGAAAGAGEVASHLERLGVGLVETLDADAEPPPEAFVLAAPRPAELPALALLNDRALAAGTPWVQLLPFDGRVLVVGPLFVPGRSACHRCYATRRGACSGYEEDYDLLQETPLRAPSPAPLAAIAGALAALLAVRWIATGDPSLPGRFYALEVGTVLGLSHEHVLRVPRCPACAPPARTVPSPWFAETA